jgi:phospholipid/cholesterol/gamma-HCH transport system substrate-binding protein
MENRAHALAAGLFTLALAAALALWGFWLSGRGQHYREPYVIVSRTAVTGLAEQAPVRYLGVDVGRVTSIRLDPDQPQTILVRVNLRPEARITDRTYAQLGYQGVTGLSYVDLRDEGPGRVLTTNGRRPATIPMRPSLLQQVGASGEELMLSARDAAQRLAEVLNAENQARFASTLRNVDEATSQFAAMQRTVAPALRGLPALSQQLEGVLARADVLVGNLNQLTVQAQKQAEALDSVARAARELGAVATDVHDVTLPRANRMIDRLTRSGESLDELLRAQRNQPLGLLLGAPPPAPGPGEPGFGAAAADAQR